MEITIKGKVSADPRDRVLAIEAVTKSICQETKMDAAEGVMMLLTAAVHIHVSHLKKGVSLERAMTTIAEALGVAIVVADDFFKLRPAPQGEAGRWRPIESAPKDDTLFLAATSDGRVMIWSGRILATAMKARTPDHLQFPATHWLPLPSPPDREG